MPWSRGHVDRQRAVDLDPPVAQQQRGHGIAADEREPAPALAVLDRLEQEPGAVADELGVGGDRASRGRRAARSTPARPCSPGPGRGTRRGSAGSALRGPEAPEEAGVLAGVARPVALLVDLEQQHVGVAVVERLADDLVVAAGVALAPDLLAAAAPVDHATLGERHAQRLGVHPGHHQHGAVEVLGDRRHEARARRT